MKNKKLVSLIIVALVTVGLITGVSAYMRKQTTTLENVFVPADVSCEVKETFDSKVKSVVQIENTSNVDVYIRVKLVSYWEDSKGNTVSRTSLPIRFTLGENWLYDSKADIYYYKNIVPENQLTSDLLDSSIELEKVEETFKYVEGSDDSPTITYEYYQVVEILAEAIQADPTEAVTEAWGVTVGTDGTITGFTS